MTERQARLDKPTCKVALSLTNFASIFLCTDKMNSNSDVNPLQTTPERKNFQHLSTLLIVGGTETLRKLLESKLPPATSLDDFLSDPRRKSTICHHLTRPQKELLYSSSGTAVDVQRLDISILFRLLRNAFGLVEPVKGWDDLPNEDDFSLEADLARIKFYRNSVYAHDTSMAVSCEDFYDLWRNISDALIRIASHVSQSYKSNMQARIGQLMHEPMDQGEVFKQIDRLIKWAEEDREERQCIKAMISQQNEKLDHVEAIIKKSSEAQQTPSPTTEQGKQSFSPKYSPTFLINTFNNFQISDQSPPNVQLSEASGPQTESLSSLSSPTGSGQLPLASVAPLPRRMSYTRQFGHDFTSPIRKRNNSNTVPYSYNSAQLNQPNTSDMSQGNFLPDSSDSINENIQVGGCLEGGATAKQQQSNG